MLLCQCRNLTGKVYIVVHFECLVFRWKKGMPSFSKPVTVRVHMLVQTC